MCINIGYAHQCIRCCLIPLDSCRNLWDNKYSHLWDLKGQIDGEIEREREREKERVVERQRE